MVCAQHSEQRDQQVTTAKQETRKFTSSVNYRKRLDVRPNRLANTLFLEQLVARRLKRLYPVDLAINGQLSIQHHTPETTPILMIEIWREKITGCLSYMSFITIATQVTKCRWTDCNIKGIKNIWGRDIGWRWARMVLTEMCGPRRDEVTGDWEIV
jgi:hypothetical protein